MAKGRLAQALDDGPTTCSQPKSRPITGASPGYAARPVHAVPTCLSGSKFATQLRESPLDCQL